MEKRLLLAAVLSFMVLYAWSLLSPQRNLSKKPSEISQTIENNEDMDFSKDALILDDAVKEVGDVSRETIKAPVENIPENVVESTEIIENEKISLELSSLGGSIKRVLVKEYDAILPVKDLSNVTDYQKRSFSAKRINSGEIQYVYEDSSVLFKKTYKLSKEDYILNIDSVIYNKMSNVKDFKISGLQVDASILDKNVDGDAEKAAAKQRDQALNEYVIYAGNKFHRKNNAYKFSSKESKDQEGFVDWVGYRDRYFCVLVKPEFRSKGYQVNYIDDKNLNITIKTEDSEIPAGQQANFVSTVYIGPEKLDVLRQYKMGFEKVKRYYKFGLFDGVSKLIYEMMHLIYKAVPNWGVCIVIISTIIYFSMYPLTMRGMASMKRMQAMQPKIVALKEKHKNNPQKMNQEMMELYKKHKINPLGGCLPMLLQMPVFIGLYQVLWRSVSFKGAGFLWIKDLSQPDRLFIMPFSLPFVGNEINILPLIMIGVMAVQQKLSAKNMVMTDPAQIQQQKMMATVFPIILGFIFYKFSSGLTLYFTMFYMFSTFTQWKMSQKPMAV